MWKILTLLLGVTLLDLKVINVQAKEIPKFEDVYWGPNEEPAELDTSIRPFKVTFPNSTVDDLKYRLKNTRKLQPPLEKVGWSYGLNSNFMPVIIDYWSNKYDFKKREEHLNQFPQFVTNIQGLDIHFIHVKPELSENHRLDVVPIYLQHGWPGSVVEFQKVIPILTTPRAGKDFVFEVVAPSMPGFGFSDAAAKRGLGSVEIAHLMKNLMQRLGFEKFYTQGGDWGAIVTADIATLYPEHVLGMHSNWCTSARRETLLKIAAYSLMPVLLPKEDRDKMYPLKSAITRFLIGGGHFQQLATWPDTIGIAMADSPAGLAAYILEKFAWGQNLNYRFEDDGKLLVKFTMDELIDNVMLYWVPNKAASSFRIFAETLRNDSLELKVQNMPITVPSACAQFPEELIHQAPTFIRDRFKNLVHLKNMPRGGHFAAMEEPELLANDVWEAVEKMRNLKSKSHPLLSKIPLLGNKLTGMHW